MTARWRIREFCPGCALTQKLWPAEAEFWIDLTDQNRTVMLWVCPDPLCGRANRNRLSAEGRANLAVLVGAGAVVPRLLPVLPDHPEAPDLDAPSLTVDDLIGGVQDLAELDRPGWEAHLTSGRG